MGKRGRRSAKGAISVIKGSHEVTRSGAGEAAWAGILGSRFYLTVSFFLLLQFFFAGDIVVLIRIIFIVSGQHGEMDFLLMLNDGLTGDKPHYLRLLR